MADGAINIDVNIPIEKAESDVQKINSLFTSVGDGAGDKLDQSFEENTDKVESDAESTHKKVIDIFGKDAEQKIKGNNSDLTEKVNDSKVKLKQLPDEAKTKLIADAKMNGIENFESLLNKLPKSKQTELLTKVSDGEVVDYEELLRKIPSKRVTEVKLNDNASSGLQKLKEEADNTSSRFSRLKDIIVGSFAGQAVYSGVAALESGLKELNSSAVEYNKAQQVSLASWTTLTNSASKGQAMVDMANNLSTKFGQARDITDELDQQFYHVLDNADKTQTLTTSFLTLADTIGLSSDQVKTLGQDFTHTMSSGKMQLGDFNQVADYLPMFGENLLKYEQKVQNNSKLTMSQLQAEMSAGKISATDAMNVINQLGDKYKASADNMMNTLPGMERAISAKAPALVSAFINPFLKAENPIAKSVMTWVNDPKTMSEMQSAGKSFSTVLTGISKAIVSALPDIKSIGGSLLSIVGTIGKTVWKVFSGVISGIAKSISGLNSNSKKSATPLDNIASAFKNIASHKTAIELLTKAFLALLVVKKVNSFKDSLIDLAGGADKVSKAMRAPGNSIKNFLGLLKPSPLTLFAIAAIAIGVAFYEAYTKSKKFREFINNLLDDIKEFSLKVYKKYLKPAITDVMDTFTDWGNQLSKFWSKNGKPLEKALNNFIDVMKIVNLGVTVSLGAMLNVFESVFGGIIREVKILWTTLKSVFSGGFEVVEGLVEVFEGIFTGNWRKVKSGVIDIVSGLWTALKGLFNGAIDTLGNLAVTVAESIINGIIGGLNAGIGAIDAVIHDFGGSKEAIGKISKVKLASGTGVLGGNRKQITQKTLAMLNDGNDSPETGNKEMLIKANGEAGIIQGRNVTTVLDPGDEVLNASETKALMSFMGVEHFASGTGIWDKIASGATKVFNDVVDKAKSIAEAIAHPVKFVESLLTKHSSLDTSVKAAMDFGGAMINGIGQGIMSPLKNLLSGLKETADEESGGSIPTADHEKLMQEAGIPSSWYDNMNWIVNVESGWKTNATNKSSGAYGLPQSLPGSKMASAGSDWKTNPVTQLKWMYDYVKDRYGTAEKAVAYHKAKGWYADGGDVSQEGLYGLAEGNQKEFVIPNPSVAGVDRSYAVLGQAAAYVGAKGGLQSNSASVDSSALENAVNKLVALQSSANTKLEKSINKKVQVVLDTGKMVGAMYSKIDQTGYSANSYQQRNVWG